MCGHIGGSSESGSKSGYWCPSWRASRLDDGARHTGCNRTEPICVTPYRYRARNLVERFFNMIKQCRRVATRYDRLAANYLAFIKLASIRIWLRAYEFTP